MIKNITIVLPSRLQEDKVRHLMLVSVIKDLCLLSQLQMPQDILQMSPYPLWQ